MKKELWPGVTQYTGTQSELCSFVPIGTGPPCPPFKFTIAIEHVEEKRPILTITLVLTPDLAMQAFIERHPKWRRDPRPLLLFLIQDLFWKLRVIDVDETKPYHRIGDVPDPKLGTSLRIEMDVIRHVATPDSTLVNLVNFANTHVYDQLAKVFEQNPDAVWSKQEITAGKSKFYEEHEEKLRAYQDRQKTNLAGWKQQTDELDVFVDESGDMGFGRTEESYIYTATVIQKSASPSFRKALLEVIEKFWEGRKPSELHFSEMSELKRTPILRRMSQILADHDATVVSHVIRKRDFLKYYLRCEAEGRRADERPMTTNLHGFLSDSEKNPQSYFLSMCFEEVVRFVAIPGVLQGLPVNFTHDRKHRTWMNGAIERGFAQANDGIDLVTEAWAGKILPKNVSLTLADSTEEPGLWISDWVGWEFGRWIRGHEISEPLAAALSNVQIISFEDQGQKVRLDRLGGKVIEEFPDWPRPPAQGVPS